MKKLIAVMGAIMIAYVILSASWTAQPRTAQTQADGAEGAVIWVMREENGRVVVYRNDTIYLRTDTAVSSLPKSDRVRLSKGITVFSEEELKKLVEDICS